MKRDFITSVCEGFLIKNNLYLEVSDPKQIELIKTNTVNEIVGLINEVRSNDIELYDKFCDRSKLTQQQIIERYLNWTFLKDEVIEEGFLKAAGATVGMGALAGAAAYGGSQGIAGMAGLAGSAVGSGLFIGPLLVLSLLFNTPSKLVMKTAAAIGQMFESLGQFLTKSGRYLKFSYAIVQENATQCYVKCGIDPSKLNIFTYMAAGKFDQLVLTIKQSKDGECLRECYIDYYVASLGLALSVYFSCLRKTGDFTQLEKLQDDDLMKVIMGTKLSAACSAYYDIIKKQFDNFHDLVNFIYTEDKNEDKQKAYFRLKDAVIKSRQESGKPQFRTEGQSQQRDNKYPKPQQRTFQQGKPYQNKLEGGYNG